MATHPVLIAAPDRVQEVIAVAAETAPPRPVEIVPVSVPETVRTTAPVAASPFPAAVETPEAFAAAGRMWAPGSRSHGMPIAIAPAAIGAADDKAPVPTAAVGDVTAAVPAANAPRVLEQPAVRLTRAAARNLVARAASERAERPAATDATGVPVRRSPWLRIAAVGAVVLALVALVLYVRGRRRG